ncbi:MarR family winged helix-turn-helix transcriptional regulator [Rhizobium halophytocola]|nr:MarR family winged helix-turn-helix transcriptional regulator [Rhizobium halophytocola]
MPEDGEEEAGGEERGSADAYRVDQQIGYFLRQANQRHVALFGERMEERLTTTQWAALTKLHELGPTSQNQLGRVTAMDVATIKGVVDRLIARGYVASAPDPTDGRRLVLSVSEVGQAAIRRNLSAAMDVSDATLSPLTSGERQMLIELLKKIC